AEVDLAGRRTVVGDTANTSTFVISRQEASVHHAVDLNGRLSESTGGGQSSQSEACSIFPLSCLKVPTGCQDFSSIKVSKVVGLQLHN
ncbi:hypothetical protein, partial [Limnohabitans sp. MMS-10A-160]|uniref:hypothetical protein n=1 Tax=Limnohabitans sp. MMS-10A-160 TaxID=1835766 RepID=UPI001E5BD33A